jgi:hypothetical protein
MVFRHVVNPLQAQHTPVQCSEFWTEADFEKWPPYLFLRQACFAASTTIRVDQRSRLFLLSCLVLVLGRFRSCNGRSGWLEDRADIGSSPAGLGSTQLKKPKSRRLVRLSQNLRTAGPGCRNSQKHYWLSRSSSGRPATSAARLRKCCETGTSLISRLGRRRA